MMKQKIQEELVRQIQQEVEYQLSENDKHEDDYRKASEYHVKSLILCKIVMSYTGPFIGASFLSVH